MSMESSCSCECPCDKVPETVLKTITDICAQQPGHIQVKLHCQSRCENGQQRFELCLQVIDPTGSSNTQPFDNVSELLNQQSQTTAHTLLTSVSPAQSWVCQKHPNPCHSSVISGLQTSMSELASQRSVFEHQSRMGGFGNTVEAAGCASAQEQSGQCEPEPVQTLTKQSSCCYSQSATLQSDCTRLRVVNYSPSNYSNKESPYTVLSNLTLCEQPSECPLTVADRYNYMSTNHSIEHNYPQPTTIRNTQTNT